MASSTTSGRAPHHGASPGRASTPLVRICAAGEGLCVGCVREGLYAGRAGVERMANSAAGEGLCADCVEEGAPRRGGSLRRPRRGGAHGQQRRVGEGLCAVASQTGAWAIAPRRGRVSAPAATGRPPWAIAPHRGGPLRRRVTDGCLGKHRRIGEGFRTASWGCTVGKGLCTVLECTILVILRGREVEGCNHHGEGEEARACDGH
jgi:hypothetical protein